LCLASKEVSMPDVGGAVGIERWELLQKAKGDMVIFLQLKLF